MIGVSSFVPTSQEQLRRVLNAGYVQVVVEGRGQYLWNTVEEEAPSCLHRSHEDVPLYHLPDDTRGSQVQSAESGDSMQQQLQLFSKLSETVGRHEHMVHRTLLDHPTNWRLTLLRL